MTIWTEDEGLVHYDATISQFSQGWRLGFVQGVSVVAFAGIVYFWFLRHWF